MLRMGMMTDKGPIGVFGITEENVLRLRAGMPLKLDIKEITPPNTRINEVYIHLAGTHEEVLNDIAEAGAEVSDEIRQQARDLDDQLKRERIARGRQ